MANQLKVNEKEAIQRLAAQKWSVRRIARELQLDRKTVRRYLRGGSDGASAEPASAEAGSLNSGLQNPPVSTAGKMESAKLGRPSVCEPHRAWIEQRLELGLTAQRIYQDLKTDIGFQGSYEAVKRLVRELKAAAPERVWRIEVQPGEELQVDFGTGAWIQPSEGSRRRSWVLRSVLSYSRRAYSEAVFEQSTENFVRCLENGYRHFNGCAKVLNLDNLKAAVTRFDRFDPEINPKVREFAKHYGIVVMPCYPKTPEHKGKIERGIGYVKCNALKGRVFKSLEEENQFLRHWESTIADQRIHGTTRRQIAAMFAEEKPALLPLPASLFPCFSEAKRTVHRDSYVEVKKSYYAVPPEYIGQEVWVRWDLRMVRVFNLEMDQIGVHARLEPGRFTQCLGIGGGQGSLERNLAYWEKRAGELGEPCAQWARRLVENRGPAAIRSLMGLSRLADKHSFKKINEACACALSHGAWRLREVERLLKRPTTQLQFSFAQTHPLVRDLKEYSNYIQDKEEHECD